MRILLVEDHVATALSLFYALKVAGHECVQAHTVKDAEDIVCRLSGIDCYIIDWWLKPEPPGSGLALLERLRASGDTTPAALVTACDVEDFRAMQARCARLEWALAARKPPDIDRLLLALDSMRIGRMAPDRGAAP